ncbi:MAG: chemotaxis protein CheW [Brevinematales bacterium]|nr:chemotaxis protein CheW [Brevinematales bacterium]
MEKQFVGFKVENNLYCIDIEYVKEVVKVNQITWMPHAPGFVRGIINLRGIIIPIISLRLKFDLVENEEKLEEYKVIIVNINNLLVGLIVDEFVYVFSAGDDKIQGLDGAGEVKIARNLINGIARIENNIFLILNVKNILDIEEQRFINKEVIDTKKSN